MWSNPSFHHGCSSASYTREILDVFSPGTLHRCWRVVIDWQETMIHLCHVLKHRLVCDICCHSLVRSRIRNWLLFIWGQTWSCFHLGTKWLGRTRHINRRTNSSFHPKLPFTWLQTWKKLKPFVFTRCSCHVNSFQPLLSFLRIDVSAISELS